MVKVWQGKDRELFILLAKMGPLKVPFRVGKITYLKNLKMQARVDCILKSSNSAKDLGVSE